MRHFSAGFKFLADLQRSLGLIESRLSGTVLVLSNNERVVVPGNCRGKPSLSNLELCSCQGLGGFCTLDSDPVQCSGRKILMDHGPFPIYVNPIIGHEPALGKCTVALRAEIVRSSRERRVQGGFCLLPILMG